MFGCLLEVKLVRIDIYVFKICLCNVMDSMVIVHFNFQLNACVNYVFFLLYKQRVVKMKTTQNQSNKTDKIKMK